MRTDEHRLSEIPPLRLEKLKCVVSKYQFLADIDTELYLSFAKIKNRYKIHAFAVKFVSVFHDMPVIDTTLYLFAQKVDFKIQPPTEDGICCFGIHWGRYP